MYSIIFVKIFHLLLHFLNKVEKKTHQYYEDVQIQLCLCTKQSKSHFVTLAKKFNF